MKKQEIINYVKRLFKNPAGVETEGAKFVSFNIHDQGDDYFFFNIFYSRKEPLFVFTNENVETEKENYRRDFSFSDITTLEKTLAGIKEFYGIEQS